MSVLRRRTTASLAAALLAITSQGLVAQSHRAPADDNGHPFHTPAGSPLEPIHRVAVVSIDRDDQARRVAFADVGDRLGFWIHRDRKGSFELAGGLHGGVFSRFDLDSSDNEFIQVHFKLGFLLRARVGSVAARAELYHVSSHLGDEFLLRTGREPISTSREGLDLLLQIEPASGLILYGGPGFVLRSSEGFESASARGGFDWELPRRSGARPYASLDVFGWSELDWDPMVAIEAGVALGRRVRLGLVGGVGPSRAEQFFREYERALGVSVSYKR